MIPPPAENLLGASADPLSARLVTSIVEAGAQLRSILRSEFGRNATWFTLLSSVERLVAVVQTVLISRALGMVEYGVYGLLFATMGFVASVAGLQMGLTATVFVSRYRVSQKEKAAAVISIVQRFGWAVGLSFVVASAPFAHELARLLLGAADYRGALILSSLLVAASIASGVQDGVAQGFELFRSLARVKLLSAAAVAGAIYPVARSFGLKGAIAAILAGLCLKYVLLKRTVAQCRSAAGIPAAGRGVSFVELISSFAIPSMAVSLLVGFVTWLGMWLLARQPHGFEEVAIVNTGMQWRGPLLLLAMSLGTVAVPAFSRYAEQKDVSGARRLRRGLVALSLAASSTVVLVLWLLSPVLLGLYGPGFSEGRRAFSLVLVSCVPIVLNQMYMQELVGSGRMWRVVMLHMPYISAWVVCLAIFVPDLKGTGFALSMLVAAVVLLVSVVVAERVDRRPIARRKAVRSNAEEGVGV